MSLSTVSIKSHTTASSPRPHVLYSVEVEGDGTELRVVQKRYSDFLALHSSFATQPPISLPPKRILTTTFIPSAWVDDSLIAERKAGLSSYLSYLVSSPEYRDSSSLRKFLAVGDGQGIEGESQDERFDLEDALPSTMTRRKALELKAELLKVDANGAAKTGEGEAKTEATFIAASYYPDWAEDTIAPENIDYSKFDILLYAFATPNSSSTLTWDSGSQALLQRLVSSANSSGAGTKIVLSVGGWSGSYWFSQAMSSSANRTTFINALSSAVSTYGLSGIDIDWEYPNSTGAGNPFSSSDSANLLSFFTSLRSKLGSSAIISAAVTDLPWLGSDGNPLTDVSSYAAQMTYVNIMNYDIFQSSSTPGPNAPLGDLCGTSSLPNYSAEAAFSQWTSAGMPASKLLLGLPLYGYVSDSTKTGLTGSLLPPSSSSAAQGNGDAKVAPRGRNARPSHPTSGVNGSTGAKGVDGKVKAQDVDLTSWYGQQIPFANIVSSGALVLGSDGVYGQGGGFTMAWDDCSDTPFLYDTSESTVVTYDDTYSLGDKAAYAKSQSMAGCFTWSMDQDDGYTLQNIIRSSLGKS
ncbi:glycoside hydrolase [Stereum hirsutum FP-91666 SS1]|uniref:glycoside hydrolase n=1 Tax=Stereum hirsutum (strain FP-91666) TaxID=721885 RepID=UPI00044492B0|nr:glycoside hydrolase [Stereum hirsutum FP-91666 SS1]EIM83169.1 glycoside hydrolase [Stereum hirsutum FP-91666 SS1]